MTSPSYPSFSFGERVGILFIAEAACLSATAVTFLLLYIGYSAVTIKQGASRKWSIVTHVHYYFLNLMFFELIQSTGGMLNIKWVVEGNVTEGMLCTVQGVLKQMGDVGVALTSLTIAVHTFCVLVLRWEFRSLTAILILISIWIFIMLIVAISVATHKGQEYYGDTEYWCWITSRYPKQRIALEYFWLWLAAFCNIVIYVFLALVIRGFIAVSGSKIRIVNREERMEQSIPISRHKFNSSTIAVQMLFYPVVYIITVLPIAVVRFTAFSGRSVPFAATAFSDLLFASSGLLNVILYTVTRPKLLPDRSITFPPTFDTPLNLFDSQIPLHNQGRLPDRPTHVVWASSQPSSPRNEKSHDVDLSVS